MILSYTLTTLWHERQRFFSAVLAVAFSAALINLQSGLLLGLFSATSSPIDNARADIWVGAPHVLSLDLARPISEDHQSRLANQAEVVHSEIYMLDFGFWTKPNGSRELCIVVGSRLGDDSLGAIRQLTPELRERLTEPGAVVIDQAELGRLGIQGIKDTAEVSGRRVRVVGLVRGFKSLTGPYVFCSLETARMLLRFQPGQTTYVLGRCADPSQASNVVGRLDGFTDMSAFTQAAFSNRTRLYWLTMTNAGISTSFTAALALLVGGVVTSQTLYAATLASLREYAVLRALGIPRWRIGAAVVAQSFGVGIVGVVLALPVVFGLGYAAEVVGTRMLLPTWLLGSVACITLAMALVSGLGALRSLRLMEPAQLLR